MKALTALRVSGKAPKLVWLLVGDCPRYIDPCWEIIHIKPGDKPAHMDFRALVMLDVTMYEVGKHDTLFTQTIHAVEAAKPATLSLACRRGVVGASDKHEEIMKTVLRTLQWRQ